MNRKFQAGWRVNTERGFDAEMLEGQAEMVGDYHSLRSSADPAEQVGRADVRRRLKGTGIYGL